MRRALHLEIDEEDVESLRRLAERDGLSLVECARQLLRAALVDARERDLERKQAVIRSAGAHSYPTADIDEMLRDIESLPLR